MGTYPRLERCPACGSKCVDQIEVDIGVGNLYGPAACQDCHWTEETDEDVFGFTNADDDDGEPF